MSIEKKHLPLWGRIILKRLFPGHDPDGALRLHEEDYWKKREKKGRLAAFAWLLFQILRALPSLIKLNILGNMMMFKNYLKVAARTLSRNRVYSSINIVGLAMGIACCLLIFFWVLDELSYDRFHEDLDRIHRVVFDQDYSGKLFRAMVTPHPLAAAIRDEIPEVEGAARVAYLSEVLIRRKEKEVAFYEDEIHAVDRDFFKIFTFPLIRGDEASVFNDPYSVVISEDAVRKYFPGEDPIGQTLTLYGRFEFTVTGVLKNVPHNSSLRFHFLIPQRLFDSLGTASSDWDSNNVPTYIKLREGASPERVAVQISQIFSRHIDTADKDYILLPMSRLHFQTRVGFNTIQGVSQSLFIFSGVAALILLIACINFMNLSTARSTYRAKEVGVRKVVGARRLDIIKQFYGESFLYTLISFIIAVFTIYIFLPVFNSLTGKSISMDLMGHWPVLLGVLGMTVFTGFLAGSYPSLYLSRFQPVRILRKGNQTGSQRSLFRRILVVAQFSISVSLIIGTGIVQDQLSYMRQKDLGFDKDRVLYMRARGGGTEVFDALQAEWKKHPGVSSVSSSEHTPSAVYSNTNGVDWEGKDSEETVSMYVTSVGYDYFETAGIDMIEGRAFSKQYSTDAERAIIVNEEAVRVMGMASPVNARFTLWDNPAVIIGVVEDFHFSSLQARIEPLIIRLQPGNAAYYLIRINPGNIAGTIKDLESAWKSVLPGYPFEYRFLDEDFDRLYRREKQMGTLLKYFSAFAIFIACLGLFGLVTFSVEHRIKEFGIRKILGASVPQIVSLICREFLLLLGLAVALSWPVAYLVMNGWLRNFAYRTGVDPLIFIVSALLAFCVALFTILLKAVKSSHSDPVHSLRHE